MSKQQVIVALGLTTDGDPAELADKKKWAKAVGIFKGNVVIEQVVMDGEAPKPRKPTKKKTGLKKRATTKKKAKKKMTRHARD